MAMYSDSNVNGLPSIHRPKPREVWKLDDGFREDNEDHRNIVELEDQLRSQREELRKRDDLIKELTVMDGRSWTVSDHGQCGITSCPSARSELAAMKSKVDSLQLKLREKQFELDAASDGNFQLRSEIDRLKEENARYLALNSELSRQINCCEASRGSFEAAQTRVNQVVASSQDQLRAAQERISELETELSKSSEKYRQEFLFRSNIENKHKTLLSGLNRQLSIECSTESFESINQKISEIMLENTNLKSQLSSQHQNQDQETETRANRETIQRLLSELSREQRTRRQQQESYSELSSDLDKLNAEKTDLSMQLRLAEERLLQMQKLQDSTKSELQEKSKRLSNLQSNENEAINRMEDAENHLKMVLNSLASILSTVGDQVLGTEESVKEKVKFICQEMNNHSKMMATVKEQERIISTKLAEQSQQNLALEDQMRRGQLSSADFKERLAVLEGELAAGDVIRDGLRADVQKFYTYMQHLAEAMKIDNVAADIGFDMLGNALISRAQQLTGISNSANNDKQSAIYNLQRKLKTMKEQLESRDLHMELLRKKIAQLEERAAGRIEVERDRENESSKVCRLQKKLEKSQQQLEQARAEIIRLKAQLLECSNLKLTALEQDRELASLESSLEKLERVRQKQAKRIADLKSESDSKQRQFGERSSVANGTLNSLGSELRMTKQMVEDLQRRERQLLELRAVVARMLGLDVESLAVPDYEIVNRLERLIQAHQTNSITMFKAEGAMQDIDASFQCGIQDAIIAAGQQDTDLPVRCRGIRKQAHESGACTRIRSVSPKRDSRKY